MVWKTAKIWKKMEIEMEYVSFLLFSVPNLASIDQINDLGRNYSCVL